VEEARFLLQLLDGRDLDLPVVFDWETVSSAEARTANMDRKTLNACALAFCRTIEEAGYDTMVYFNLDLGRRMFQLLKLQEEGYDFWLAMYSDQLNYAYRVRMWQYTSSGTVAGIRGNVDLNLYFPDA
jgi:GH25 family lysozyme M1 (1,4-beta-N-acetylmuramidase)